LVGDCIANQFQRHSTSRGIHMRDQVSEFRTSPAIIAFPVADYQNNRSTIGVYEFLSKSFAYCPIEMLHWLSYFTTARTVADARRDHAQYAAASLDSDIEGLIDANFLVEVDSDLGRRCESYRRNWEWDMTTAAFHFTVLDNQFCTTEESVDYQLARMANENQPNYFWTCQKQTRIALPSPCCDDGADTLSLLAKRRTVRLGSATSISLHELSSCLFASFGITGLVKSTTGDMPLTMTPSGGARNPYEAYVIVRRCAGLEAGVYRYSAMEHALEFVQSINPSNSISNLFAGQDWMDEMAVVVVMVAVFERTMWKYQDPNAYRVILIEAGHKAQNFMIMATRLGMSACPSAALAHEPLSDLLMLQDKMMQVPIYAFSLDRAMPNHDEITSSSTYDKFLKANASLVPQQQDK
jgi:SagB-type dehydrogenase family enzyme